jgi:hypothetical protein
MRKRRVGQDRGPIGLVEEIVGAVVLRRVRADAVEADLRRLAPAAENGEVAAAIEHSRRDELGLDAFVPGNGVAAADVERVIGAEVLVVAEAEREAAAGVCALEVRVPLQ